MAIDWGSVADWVSGLGSLSAVVTALYFASDSQKIKLDGYCGIRLVVGNGGPQKELIWISVTNVGSRTAIINNVGMRIGRFKKRRAIITFSKDIYSDGVPVELADGQVAKWGLPLTEDKKWIKDLVDGFIETEDDIRTLRFTIFTTHGAMKVIKPEDSLKQEIQKALRAKRT
jgi:hypothetical protein